MKSIGMLKTLLEDLYLADDELDCMLDDLHHYSNSYQNKILNISADILNLINSINAYAYNE